MVISAWIAASGATATAATGRQADETDEESTRLFSTQQPPLVEDLLQISDFLTQFRSLYEWDSTQTTTPSSADDNKKDRGENNTVKDTSHESWKGDTVKETAKNHIITTPQDLLNAYALRELLQQAEHLLEDEYLMEFHNHDISSSHRYICANNEGSTAIAKKIDRVQKAITHITTSTKAYETHQLLERFEVWSTKAAAQHLLISHEPSEKTTPTADISCWSTVMGLPTAWYSSVRWLPFDGPVSELNSPFARLWDEQYNHGMVDGGGRHVHPADQPCALSVSPNNYTWEAFSRICYMISLLPYPDRIHQSPLTRGDRNPRGPTSVKYHLNPTDLVALWVRSRRNSQAFRHLIQLFGFEKGLDNGTVVEAIYKGNHPNTHRRVAKESPLIEQLVRWAVVNQVVRTYPAVIDLLAPSPRKRRRTIEPPLSPIFSNSYKRMAKNPKHAPIDEIAEYNFDRKELFMACQQHLLRRFAYSHSRMLSVLFYSAKKESAQETVILNEAEKARLGGVPVDDRTISLLNQGIDRNIKNMLLQVVGDNDRAGDRTLTRIDRRICKGRFDNDMTPFQQSEGSVDLFHEAVINLLKAMQGACQLLDDGYNEAEHVSLQQDFHLKYREFVDFCENYDLIAAARSFLRYDETVPANNLAHVLRTFPPPWVEACAICQKSAFATEFTGFLRCGCCQAAMHKECIPEEYIGTVNSKDFVLGDPILQSAFPSQFTEAPPDFRNSEWEEQVVTLERSLQPDGTLTRIGLILSPTEECINSYEAVLAAPSSVHRADVSFPVAIPVTGMLVVAVSNEKVCCGNKCGIRVGDVVTGVELHDLALGDEPYKHGSGKLYVLREFSIKERFELLRKSLRLTIQRPTGNPTDAANNWLERARQHIARISDSFSDSDKIWVCPSCRRMVSDDAREKFTVTIYQEARRCQAIVRRLAMDEVLAPFLDEEHFTIDDCGRICSLRRLDVIMSWIQYKASKIANEASDEVQSSPFYFAGRRLTWVSTDLESSPSNLLCRGIAVLVASETLVVNEALSLRKHLLTKFITLYYTWCAGACVSEGLAVITNGPPSFAFLTPFPGADKYCKCCAIRTTAKSESDPFCSICLNLATGESPVSPRLDLAVASYEKCAALVGKSIFCRPGDPLLNDVMDALAKHEGVFVDHDERLVEFIIVSYLPPAAISSSNVTSGVFHAIPVVGETQLKFLLERCNLRDLASSPISEWGRDPVLNLHGVATLSLNEILIKLHDSKILMDKIDDYVAKQAQCVCTLTLKSLLHTGPSIPLEHAQYIPCSCPAQIPSNTNCMNLASYHVQILETLFNSRSPLFVGKNDRSEPIIEDEVRFLPERQDNFESSIVHDEENPRFVFTSGNIRKYNVVYSDIIISKKDGEEIEPTKNIGSLFEPKHGPVQYKTLNVVLTRKQISCRTPTVDLHLTCGWGFEILQWYDEERLRIGRVQQDSIALEAGIRSGDIIETINGSPVNSSSTSIFLMWALLGLHPLCTTSRSWKDVVLSFVSQGIHYSNGNPVIVGIRRAQIVRDSDRHVINRVESIPNPEPSRNEHIGTETMRRNPQNVDCSVQPAGRPIAYRGSYSPNSVVTYRYTDVANVVEAIQSNMKSTLRSSVAGYLLANHLYMSCLPGSVLTIAESATFLEAITQDLPMLGMRMLRPRYSIEVLKRELEQFSRCPTLHLVPQLSQLMWRVLLDMDYARSLEEPANSQLCFFDKSYSYRMPIKKFPIDRIIENHICLAGPSRIRGGGGDEDNNSRRKLPHVNSNDWLHTLVHGNYIPSVNGNRTNQIQKFIGYIESFSDPGNICVEIFYLADRGIIAPIMMTFDVKHLKLVASQSKEHSVAESWGKFTIGGALGRLFVIKNKASSGNNGSASVADDAVQRPGQAYSGQLSEIGETQMKLSRVSRLNWSGLIVHGRARTEARLEVQFVGYVELAVSDRQASVKIFYLSTHGIIIKPLSMNFNPNKLKLVMPDSDKHKISIRWNNRVDSTPEGFLRVQNAISDNPQSQQAHGRSDFVNVNTSGQDAASSLVDRARCNWQCLGFLPGGHSLHYFSSDRNGLYVASDSLSIFYGDTQSLGTCNFQKWRSTDAFDPAIISAPEWPYICPWGCICNVSESPDGIKRCLSFRALSELQNHLTLHHSFGCISVTNNSKSELSRISHGEQIRSLLVALTGAACARSHDLVSFAVQAGKNPPLRDAASSFRLSPMPNLLCFDRDALSLGNIGNLHPSASQLCSTVMAIFQRFDMFGNPVHSLEAKSVPRESHLDTDIRSGNLFHRPSSSCRVCDLAAERTVAGNGATNYRSLGCASLCHSLLESDPKEDERISYAKRLLISVAQRLPQLLMGSGSRKLTTNSPHQVVWDSHTARNWKAFALGSRNWESLCQAFAVLLTAVNNEKLPKWWKDEGSGWSDVQPILGAHRISELMMKIYSFDAAVTEYVSSSVSDGPDYVSSIELPIEYQKLSYEEIMGKIYFFMNEQKMELFDGENSQYCCVCRDGGDLLCCDLCANVQHVSCTKPRPASNAPDYFFCNSCIADVSALSKSISTNTVHGL